MIYSDEYHRRLQHVCFNQVCIQYPGYVVRFKQGLNRNIGRLEVTEAQEPNPRRTCALRCASSTGNGKWMRMVKIPLEQSPFPVKA